MISTPNNVIAFPPAAGVFDPFVLGPEIAALAMSGSSAVVAINAVVPECTKLAGIHQLGRNGMFGASGRPAIPDPAKLSAVRANPLPNKKEAA